MNIEHARQIAIYTFEMAEVVSRFHAQFGYDYHLTSDSPSEAWELHHACMDKQLLIARLLDTEAVANAYTQNSEWWKRRDMITAYFLDQMLTQTLRLLTFIIYQESRDTTLNSRNTQESIAGMLHPTVRQQIA